MPNYNGNTNVLTFLIVALVISTNRKLLAMFRNIRSQTIPTVSEPWR